MTRDAATASLIDGVGLLERALGYTRGSLQLVRPDAMALPSPCAGWDLRALLVHMNDSLAALHEAGDVGRVAPPDGRSEDGPGADPVASLRDLGCRMLGAWADPGGREWVTVDGCPVTGGLVTATGALEIAVHGWDVAETVGQRRPIPPALAEELLPLAELLVSDEDRASRFGPPLPAPAGAAPDVRLLAFLGRRAAGTPELEPGPGPGPEPEPGPRPRPGPGPR